MQLRLGQKSSALSRHIGLVTFIFRCRLAPAESRIEVKQRECSRVTRTLTASDCPEHDRISNITLIYRKAAAVQHLPWRQRNMLVVRTTLCLRR